MTAIDTILFEQFADALNRELVAIGATLRVAPRAPAVCGSILLHDAGGHPVGALPDHVDAATIKALEAIINARDTMQRS